MSRALSPGSRRPYGLVRVCRGWRTARATVYRHRPTPGGAAAASWAGRGDAGCGAAGCDPRRPRGQPFPWRRAPQGLGQAAPRRRAHVSTLGAAADARAWPARAVARPSDARPALPRRHHHPCGRHLGHGPGHHHHQRGPSGVFVALDHCSAECVGLHAAERANRFEALEPIRQGVRRCFGAFGKGVVRGPRCPARHRLAVHGRCLPEGAALPRHEGSPAFVRAPEGSGCFERFIPPLKESCCGCGPSTPSRSCTTRCSTSARPTARPGARCLISAFAGGTTSM
jgi:hypothetical protein